MVTKIVHDADSFLSGVGELYDSIKCECNNKISLLGMKFNDDVFSETIVKCYETISNEKHENIDIAAYFWSSFKQNTVNDRKKWINHTVDTIPDTPSKDNAFESFEYSDTMSLVMKHLVASFGEEVVDLYIQHVNGLTYKELLKVSNIKSLNYQFRKIKKTLHTIKKFIVL